MISRTTRFVTFLTTALALSASAISTVSHAQDSQPTRLIIPYVAGGATDTVARLLAQQLEERWGQVVVENRPGAAGTIATRVTALAKPDGHTLIVVTSAHSINELVYANLPYDTVKDFSPIAQITEVPNVLLTGKESPYKTLDDIIAADKANPGSIQYGTAGVGTSVHLAGEMLTSMTGSQIYPVHFKGDGESVVALMGGHIPISFNTVPGSQTQIKAGNVRPLAVTTEQRVGILPDVPTISEAGVPGYAVGNWFGILGPAGIDPERVAQLNSDIQAAIEAPEIRAKLETMGITVKTGSAEEFDALIQGDIKKWRPIIEKLGLRNDNP